MEKMSGRRGVSRRCIVECCLNEARKMRKSRWGMHCVREELQPGKCHAALRWYDIGQIRKRYEVYDKNMYELEWSKCEAKGAGRDDGDFGPGGRLK